MTAKQRHRADLLARAGRNPTCELEHRGGCRGELQADHVVEVAWLKAWLGRLVYRNGAPACLRCGGTGAIAVIAGGKVVAVGALDANEVVDGAAPAPCPDCAGRGNATLEAIVADARNGWLLCERHHGLKTGGMILPPITRDELPDELDAFLTDYRCARLLRNRAAFAVA